MDSIVVYHIVMRQKKKEEAEVRAESAGWHAGMEQGGGGYANRPVGRQLWQRIVSSPARGAAVVALQRRCHAHQRFCKLRDQGRLKSGNITVLANDDREAGHIHLPGSEADHEGPTKAEKQARGESGIIFQGDPASGAKAVLAGSVHHALALTAASQDPGMTFALPIGFPLHTNALRCRNTETRCPVPPLSGTSPRTRRTGSMWRIW
jgi:hypothetical protein